MDGVLAWGLGVVRAVQTIESPALTLFVKAVTFLGSQYAYLLLVPIVYWCIDEKKGVRLGVMVLFSAWLNLTAKQIIGQPRPYDLDPSVARGHEKTFGLPSGHAQGATVMWGIVGSWLRAPFGIWLAVLAPLAIGFTRVYLGVHFPTDLLGGWFLGGLILAGYFFVGPFLEALLSAARRQVRLILLAGIVFAMNALHPQDVSIGGVFLGMGIGYILMKERFPFSAALAADGTRAALPVRAGRYALGMFGAGILYAGLKFVFPGEGASQYALFRFLRYGLVGFWIAAGAPWAFLRLKLVAALPADE